MYEVTWYVISIFHEVGIDLGEWKQNRIWIPRITYDVTNYTNICTALCQNQWYFKGIKKTIPQCCEQRNIWVIIERYLYIFTRKLLYYRLAEKNRAVAFIHGGYSVVGTHKSENEALVNSEEFIIYVFQFNISHRIEEFFYFFCGSFIMGHWQSCAWIWRVIAST